MIVHCITWRRAPRVSGHNNANRVAEVLGNMSVAILKLIYLTQWKISVCQRTSAGSVSVESGSGILLVSCYTYELVTQIELIREYYNQFMGCNYLWFASNLLLHLIRLFCFFSYISSEMAMLQNILCSKTTRVTTFAEIGWVLTSFVMNIAEIRLLENLFSLVSNYRQWNKSRSLQEDDAWRLVTVRMDVNISGEYIIPSASYLKERGRNFPLPECIVS